MTPAERSGPPDEKVTINLGPVDLGRVDLLVSEGVFSSRTDFIRTSVRRQLEDHEQLLQEVVTRKEFTVGFLYHTRADLERYRSKGERLHIKVIGVYKLGEGVTKQLVNDVLENVTVLGSLRGPKAVVDSMKKNTREAHP
ncbi:MAG: CopG family transcriptional regulator [Actinomycetota bacterium]